MRFRSLKEAWELEMSHDVIEDALEHGHLLHRAELATLVPDVPLEVAVHLPGPHHVLPRSSTRVGFRNRDRFFAPVWQ